LKHPYLYDHSRENLPQRPVVDRSEFPTADEEYTSAKRRTINTRLAKSDLDTQHGRVYGPFSTAEEMAASIEANVKKLRAPKRKSKPAQ
jgi:hypothetical protein